MTEFDWLFAEAFSPANAGYRPNLREIPNGDGKVDHGKRFAHVNPHRYRHSPDLTTFYAQELAHARDLATRLDLPTPGPDSTLRFLEYPSGVGGERHTDFSMFTRSVYQSGPGLVVEGPPSLEPLLHIGELAELINPELKAAPHYVVPGPMLRRSIVFFAMPPFDHILPCRTAVGVWVAERKARSRVLAAEGPEPVLAP